MTEPQVWVLIGVFATAVFGMLTWQTVMFNRALASFREKIEVRFDTVDAKFEVVNVKIDNLGRDVQALTRRVFGTDSL